MGLYPRKALFFGDGEGDDFSFRDFQGFHPQIYKKLGLQESKETGRYTLLFHRIDNTTGLIKVLLGYFHLSYLSILELKSFLL